MLHASKARCYSSFVQSEATIANSSQPNTVKTKLYFPVFRRTNSRTREAWHYENPMSGHPVAGSGRNKWVGIYQDSISLRLDIQGRSCIMIFPSICCLEDPFNSWDRRVKTAVLSCCTWCSHPNKAYTKELVFSRRHLARMVTKRSIRESSPAGIKPKHRKKAMIARGSSSRVSGYYPPAIVMSSDDEEIICTAAHIPGGHSALPANRSRSQNNSPTLPVKEESTSIRISNTPSTRSISPEPVPIRANMNSPVLCLVTQENFPLETCLVLRVSPELEGDMGSRLAHVWGFDSLEGLDFRLKNSSFNRMTLRMDFVPRFGSVYGGHWALVPDLGTLRNILSQVKRANSLGQPALYLDEFPNDLRAYRYVPLRGDMDTFLRLTPGVKDGDGITRHTLHKFPFEGLELRSNVHPYFAIANAAQKAIHAWGGRSHIPQLPEELRTSLQVCIDIYTRWLKKRAMGTTTQARN